MNQPPWILYEDDHCLAVAKPAGQFPLGTWSPPGETTLEGAVRSYLDSANPGGVYLGIVHRLDRPTSGVLIWAKTPKAARRLARQFETRRAIKEYWAVVELTSRSTASMVGCPVQPQLLPAPRDRLSRETWVDALTRPDRAGLVRIVPRQTAARARPSRKSQSAQPYRCPKGACGCGFGPGPGGLINSGCRPRPEACPSWVTRFTGQAVLSSRPARSRFMHIDCRCCIPSREPRWS